MLCSKEPVPCFALSPVIPRVRARAADLGQMNADHLLGYGHLKHHHLVCSVVVITRRQSINTLTVYSIAESRWIE